ncbi:MAG: DNA repair protein RecO [Firmicutes bacterium]|jgi:DNA repair protein RecO (recombination protein O)|nr:DNA repair protein RecO [Bacillota bacterium]MCL5064819.1 DNA repair protein RecO [Bacillota bacterium]
MPAYRDQGIVLRCKLYRDNDSLVTLFLINHGKVAAVGRGVRNPKSPLNGGLYPLSYSGFELYRGRSSLESITTADVIRGFGKIRGDLDRIGWASVLAEVVDECFSDHDPAPEAFYILVAGLQALNEGRHPPSAAMAAIWQLLRAAGFVDRFDYCPHCGVRLDGPLLWVSGAKDPSCPLCAGSKRTKTFSSGAVKTVNRWLEATPDKFGGVEVRGRLIQEMVDWLSMTLASQIHRIPKSLGFINQLLDQEVEEPR